MEKEISSNLAEELKKQDVSKEKRKIILRHVRERYEKERTMKLSIKEGSATTVMSGFGNDYIIPYSLALNANNAQIGFLSAFSNLLSPISQIFGSKLMEKYTRKKIIVIFVALQALMWLPILLLSLLFWKNIFSNYLPIILIVFYTFYAIFGAVAGPSWFSLMGDIVPEKIRGRYFGKRNKITGATALLATIAAAFILDYYKTKGFVLIGFSILFFLACIFRLIAAGMFKKHYEPEFKLEKGYYFSIFQFIKKAPFNNFGKFVIFVALMNFSVMIAGPFFTVYMLNDLKFSYTMYMLVNLTASIFSLLFMPIWGKFSDKFGNRELLKIGSILVPIVPILWLFSSSPLYLIIIPQIVAGIGWAAFNLAAGNFIYDSVSVQRRGLCVAYYNISIGIGIFLGAGLGGLLAHYLTISFMNKLLFIFLISGIARLLVSLIMLPRIKEIREVEKTKSNPVWYLKQIRPVSGVIGEIMHDAVKIKDGIASVGGKKGGKFSFKI